MSDIDEIQINAYVMNVKTRSIGKLVDKNFQGKYAALQVDDGIILCDPADIMALVPNTIYQDVGDFHIKFGLPNANDGKTLINQLDRDAAQYRVNFMQEELDEFKKAFDEENLADQADALVDLCYVAMGTAQLMGLPFDELFAEVQKANMAKERATGSDDSRSKRKHSLDVVKPQGWKKPDIEGVLRAHGHS